MIKKLIPKTIRSKIMAVTAAITFIITILTVTVCFHVFQSFLKKNQIQSAEFSLQLTGNNIAADINDITYLANWCCSSSDIRNYLKSFDKQEKLPIAARANTNLRSTALDTYNRLKEEYYSNRARRHIPRIIVSTVNRNNFLQIITTSNSTSAYTANTVYGSDFFDTLYQAKDFLWPGLVDDPFFRVDPEQILPVVRPIYNEYNSEVVGWVYIGVSSSLFTNYLSSYPLAEDSTLFLKVGNNYYGVGKNGWFEAETPYTILENGDGSSTLDPATSVMKVAMADGSRRTLISRPIEGMNGCSISQILSEHQFKQQTTVYTMLIVGICAAIISLGILMAVILNRIINQPIRLLLAKLDAISAGDFSKDPAIEWEHELGQIGKGINNMSGNIVSLMDKRVSDEKQKKDLEYQILQSQINPHFLYNTLNSIKWMATIQNATGIADMTTALARLMKSVSKGTSSVVTLREELDLVRDYFLIQQYRYGGSITIEYDIESEDLYDCEIHRFTLQPIIENALFHGIEPKGTAGKILVSARAEAGKDLVISITDNGIGMTPETIEKVLHEDTASKNKADFFKQVGISNVNQRIKYDCGPQYGITIASEVGVYTTATIRRPYKNRNLQWKE